MQESNILIVDDSPDNIFLLEVILGNQGFKTIAATNGLEAIDEVQKHKIDLILMDVMMPEMDGFEASRHIHQMKGYEHIPIILITAKKREADDVIRGLGEGAVEYLTKPFDDNELVARAKSMLRIKHLHDANAELLAKITEQQRQMEIELRMAEKVQREMLPSPEFLESIKECKVAAHYQAASQIGGDIYDFYRYGENRMAMLIADVTGHGPAAALIVALMKAALSSESEGHPEPHELARRLNKRLLPMMPDSHFITMFFAVADFAKGTLSYVTAGHPPPFIINSNDAETRKFISTGTFLGMFEDGDAFFDTETISIQKGDKLVFFSDGVYETRNSTGEEFGMDRIGQFMLDNKGKDAKGLADGLMESVRVFWDGVSEQDDIAVVAVEFTQ